MPQTKTIDEILVCYGRWVVGNTSNKVKTLDHEQSRQALADLILALPSLQPIPRIKSIHADNSLAIKVDEIRQEIAEALGVSNAPLR